MLSFIGIPHRHCLLDNLPVLAVFVGANAAIAFAYIKIPITMWQLREQVQQVGIEAAEVVRLLCAFVLSCAITHLLAIATLFIPWYRLEGLALVLCAIVSVFASFYISALASKLRHEDQ